MIETGRHPLSPASLLHPAGPARRVVAVGSAVPSILSPSAPASGEAADVLIIAPDSAEGRSSAWRGGALAAAGEAAPGSLVYLLADRRSRTALAHELLKTGWRAAGAWLHLPDVARSSMMVPASHAGLRYALDMLPTRRRGARRALSSLLAVPGGARLLARHAPGVGIALSRGGVRQPMEWLARGGASVALLPGWRLGSGRATAVTLDRDGRAEWVTKIALDAAAEATLAREAALLMELGGSARAAGARVPMPLDGAESAPDRFTQSGLPGPTFATLLARGALQPAAAVRMVGNWLNRWHRETTAPVPARQVFEERLLAPLAELCGDMREWERYRTLLEARVAAAETVPSVAVHGDLTMTNLLLDAGRLGVVDWEAASGGGLPLGDMAYAAVDLVLWAGAPTRVAAYEACFQQGGSLYAAVDGMLAAAAAAVELSPEQASLCLDACWVAHAANERRRAAPGGERPFLAVLERHAAAALA